MKYLILTLYQKLRLHYYTWRLEMAQQRLDRERRRQVS